MLSKLKKLNPSTSIQLGILLVGLALITLSYIAFNYFNYEQLQNIKKIQNKVDEYQFKLKILSDHNVGTFKNITLGKIDKTQIIKELKDYAKDLNYISYEFKATKPIDFIYNGKKIQSQPVILKIKSISDNQIYDLVNQIKDSKNSLVQPKNLSIAKIRNIDGTVSLQSLQDKEVDIFKTIFEFEVIGYA